MIASRRPADQTPGGRGFSRTTRVSPRPSFVEGVKGMRKGFLVGLAGLALIAAACGGTSSASSGGQPCSSSKTPVITLAAYSTVYDTYGKLISAFQDKWKEDHNGQSVIFQTSFGGSTTQAQNVANGFGADIVALSLAPDVDIIQKAG